MSEIPIPIHPRPSWGTIGDLARERRGDRQVADVAAVAGIDASLIEALENGRGDTLDAYEISRSAAALSLTVGELVAGDSLQPLFRGAGPSDEREEAVRLGRELMEQHLTAVLLQPPA